MTYFPRLTAWAVILMCLSAAIAAQPTGSAATGVGYYRYPAIHNETIVFTSEGDLWSVGIDGGTARRLTTHHGSEILAAISPDGRWLAFTAEYEGPREAYIMPLSGGLPTRVTWEGQSSYVAGWTPDGDLLYSTSKFSTLPRYELLRYDPDASKHTLLPLAQARYGCYDAAGKVLFFTRHPFQGSWAKRYKGGTAQNVWRFGRGDSEAALLTGDYAGTSKEPMWYDGRVYFLSDRDGTMNIWSMLPDGSDLRQHTSHDGWDVQSASVHAGRIVYHVGADLYLLDIKSGQSKKLDIALASDFDQKREKWIDKPMEWLTSTDLSPSGDKVALTARGQVFVAPVEQGRLVRATRRDEVRYRNAVFMPGGDSVLVLSDESGEVEFWTVPADGIGEPKQLSDDGSILRWAGVPSPDGKMIAYHDKNQKLWIFDIARKSHTLLDSSLSWGIRDLAWSPDSRWLAASGYAANRFVQISVYSAESGNKHVITADRFHSFSPAWSPDGKWLYFISDRNYETIYGGVWGTRQQEPFFDKTCELFMLPLTEAVRSPFDITTDEMESPKPDSEEEGEGDKEDKDTSGADVHVEITFDGLAERLIKVPVPPGEYDGLSANETQLFWTSRPVTGDRKRELQTIKIGDHDADVKTLADGYEWYELSDDGKKVLVRTRGDIFVFDAGLSKPSDMSKSRVDLSGWTFSLDPVLEWRQMFTEAWRLHRDYFYDPNMLDVDWPAVLKKYLPLVDRVSDRAELSNLLGQMVSELETLHTSVYGGDMRSGEDDVNVARLGTRLELVDGGYRIAHIYRTDPDYPDELSPLAPAYLDLEAGDVITAINGVKLDAKTQPGRLLRHQNGKQVLLTIKDVSRDEDRNVVVKPINALAERDLRYNEWEYTRRLQVEEEGDGEIGYVHFRNTGTHEFGRFARDYYPVFQRAGLIIDNRHNSGGNIDSWIISRLMRPAWAWWQSRVGLPDPNMQFPFLGHIVVLCNEWTASDGELMTEGLRRVLDARVIGTRTWGGEVWLSSSNTLVDRGIATAAESGVYSPEGEWLIEGHGVDPDTVVENLPHATFTGRDAQLEAAIEYLKQKIREEPVKVPVHPPYPDKSPE